MLVGNGKKFKASKSLILMTVVQTRWCPVKHAGIWLSWLQRKVV